MSDIDKIIKVNNLAKELLTQGRASSRDEAVKMAEQMLSTSVIEPSTKAQHAQSSQQQVAQSAEAAQEQPSQQVSNNNELVEKMYDFMKKQFEVYKENIVALNSNLNQLKEELQRLKSEIARQKAAEPRTEQKQDQPQSGHPSKEVRDPKSHPRMGNYNPDQVSVEKMFYYGK